MLSHRLRRSAPPWGSLGWTIGALLSLPACLPDWDTYQARSEVLTDDDGDGQSELDGDCNDRDPDVSPGTPEVCDGRDNDCDHAIDEDPTGDNTEWYRDTDGDAWGVEGEPVRACGRPAEGYVNRVGDCDDADITNSPDAAERCDEVDNDCDGAVDEAPTINTPTWYPDLDGDGFGDSAGATSTCEAPAGHVERGGDCDDDAPEIFPGAEERCDGLDNDCDGVEDDPPLTGAGAWFPDLDGDGYGDGASADARCAETAGFITTTGDCDDTDEHTNPDQPEVCDDGADNNCDGLNDPCDWDAEVDMTNGVTITSPFEDDAFGWQVSQGDLDGDGRRELIASAYYGYSETTMDRPGFLHVFESYLTADTSRMTASLTFEGPSNSGLGYGLDIGDLNGDGQDDLLTSGYYESVSGRSGVGRTYVLYGPISEGGSIASLADWTLAGRDTGSTFGRELAVLRDVTGDGQVDFASGSIRDDLYAMDAGVVYIFSGLGLGLDEAEGENVARVHGVKADQNIGISIASWDHDGDGDADLVLGGDTSDGPAFMIFDAPVSGSLSSLDADVSLNADTSGDGNALGEAADLNGDGLDDMIFGAMNGGTYGSAYILFGGTTLSSANLSDANIKIRSTHTYANLGGLVNTVGDLNQDGEIDVLVGEQGSVPDYIHVFYGPLDVDQTLTAGADSDILLSGDGTTDWGYNAAFNAGDITGDATDDLVVGCDTHDDYSGAVYIIPGIGG